MKEKQKNRASRRVALFFVCCGVLITHSFFRLDAGCIEPSPFGLLP